jgi:hypothetical protein
MSKARWFATIASSLLVCLGASGCCSTIRIYDGPQLPKDQVGVLGLFGGPIVVAVDGQVNSEWQRRTSSVVLEVELLPGDHTITFDFIRVIPDKPTYIPGVISIYRPDGEEYAGPQNVTFTVLPGHKYALDCSMKGLIYGPVGWKAIKILDRTAKRIVFQRTIDK